MDEPNETTRQSNWRQFCLLLWKNWLLQKKKVGETVGIFIMPLFYSVMLISDRNVKKPSFSSNATTYDSFFVFPHMNDDDQFTFPPTNFILAYVPNTNLVAGIVNRATTLMGVKNPNNMGFASEKDVEFDLSTYPNIYGAIVFPDSDQWSSLPKSIVYKIRLSSHHGKWETSAMFDTLHTTEPRDVGDKFGGNKPGYYHSGFLAIQHAVDLSIIAAVNKSFDPAAMNVTTQLKRYPFPPYSEDSFVSNIKDYLSLYIVFSFFVVASTIGQEIVLEKENKFKESMKLMGMRTWLYWSSWFVKYLLLMLVSVIIIMIVCHAQLSSNGPVLEHCSVTVTFVFLLIYTVSFITFCIAVSTVISKAIYGSVIGMVFFILLYSPCFYLSTIYNDMTLLQKLGASFDFNLAMAFGCIKIYQYEALGIDLQWSNIGSLAFAQDNYRMSYAFIMLLVDTVIHSLLIWYLDAVVPGQFGTPQPLYFPFVREYWIGRREERIELLEEDFITLVPEARRPYFEIPLQEAKAGIQIRGLTKNFGSETNPAVNNLNIDIYEGNITALVGHNGAGKTTAMFMLTGFLPPTKGTAYINGFEIKREMDEIRQNLGLCPQHDILFDKLTVREHLLFYAVLKGSSFNTAPVQVAEMIKVLHMEEKINAQAKRLSGGQRRKLSVGIALIAGSKFVILDEPTSGMDPEARRQTWDILQSQRKDRTMLLSTHYMDEADVLGDRVAIMSKGELQCYGTPMFLKNKYGVGYHLTIVKTSTCEVVQLRKVIKSQIRTAHMVSDEAGEVMFSLPSNQASTFEALFKILETDGKTLGIQSFGISVTTMEEVFLRVKDSFTLESRPSIGIAANAEELRNSSPTDVLYRTETGWRRQSLQLRAMFYKRYIQSRRNYVLTLGQILVPVILTILVILVNTSRQTDDHIFKPLTLDLTHFISPITPYDVRNTSADAQKLSGCYSASVSRQRQSKAVLINSEEGYSTMDDYLLSIAKDHRYEYNWNYQIGATIEEIPEGDLNITGLFNNQAFHTIAISLSFLGNTLMQCYGDKEHQIKTINHPFPKISSKQIEKTVRSGYFSYGMIVPFAICLFFLIKERTSGAKHSQLVSGVSLRNFWLATFICDYVTYLVACILLIIIILVFEIDAYWQRSWVIFIGLMVFGISMLQFTYVLSLLFTEPSGGVSWFIMIYFVPGAIASVVMSLLKQDTYEDTWLAMEYIFYIFFPSYGFDAIFENTYSNFNNQRDCDQKVRRSKLAELCLSMKERRVLHPCCPDNCGKNCLRTVDNYFSWSNPGIGRSMVFMVIQGIVFFLILYTVETNNAARLLKRVTPNKVDQASLIEMDVDEGGKKIIEDSDVVEERQRIRSKSIQELSRTNSVITQDLTKLYGNLVAVNRLCIGVSPKECFGLLGVNGAGKTSVFKMLTGEIQPSFGSAYVAGLCVQKDLADLRQKIGYCPQFDSIIDQMTVYETLWMYACAHGIPPYAMEQIIDHLMEHLTLKPYIDTRAGKLSGGNKRKLCVAVALMGNPTVVFLDEPTTGVDPEARRRVWNTLAAARNTGATIVLTSHSMEECEAICTRMGILVNGRFLCLGSLQHLRDKFSFGYSLTIKLQRSATTDKHGDHQERVEKLKAFVSRTFPNSFLKDHHENMLSYQVNVPTFKWSEVFGIMEKAKVKYEIEDYSVGQTTLEQLFIAFARLQRGAREIAKKKFCGLC